MAAGELIGGLHGFLLRLLESEHQMFLLKRTLRIALGCILLVLGLAGLVLPILQGWLFIGLAVIILSRDIPFFARLEDRVAARFPGIRRIAERVRKVIPIWDD